jgi:hypothetical protein
MNDDAAPFYPLTVGNAARFLRGRWMHALHIREQMRIINLASWGSQLYTAMVTSTNECTAAKKLFFKGNN